MLRQREHKAWLKFQSIIIINLQGNKIYFQLLLKLPNHTPGWR